MLKCIVCGKIIANVDPSVIHYGGCASCPLDKVKEGMEQLKKEEINGSM